MTARRTKPPTTAPGAAPERRTEVAALLAAAIAAGLIEQRTESDGTLHVRVEAAAWRAAAETLAGGGFARLEFLTCVDWDDHFSLTLQVYEMESRTVVRLVTHIPRDGVDVPTLSDLWPAADWEERETHDQFGLVFSDHPDLRRILNPQNWEGHPLRRDYVDHVDITRPQYF